MQKPILLGVDGQAREIVQSYEAGIYFEPEDEQAFLPAVETISKDKELYARLQAKGSLLAKAYDRKKLAGEMLAVIESVNGKSKELGDSGATRRWGETETRRQKTRRRRTEGR